MTVLVRLNEKGVVTRRRDGRAYAYRPVHTRDEDAAARQALAAAASTTRLAALVTAALAGGVLALEAGPVTVAVPTLLRSSGWSRLAQACERMLVASVHVSVAPEMAAFGGVERLAR